MLLQPQLRDCENSFGVGFRPPFPPAVAHRTLLSAPPQRQTDPRVALKSGSQHRAGRQKGSRRALSAACSSDATRLRARARAIASTSTRTRAGTSTRAIAIAKTCRLEVCGRGSQQRRARRRIQALQPVAHKPRSCSTGVRESCSTDPA